MPLVGYAKFLSLLAGGLVSIEAAASQVVLLKGAPESISINQAEIIVDESHQLTWESIREVETGVWKTTKNFNFGYTSAQIWVRFNLKSSAQEPLNRFLEVGYPLIQAVEIAVLSRSATSSFWKVGRFIPVKRRPIPGRRYLFPLKIGPGEEVQVLLRAESRGTLRLPLKIHSDQTIIEATEPASTISGMYFGAIAALCVYNIFLLIALRDRRFFFYLAYISSFGLLQSALLGYGGAYLWREESFWNGMSVPFLVGISFLSLSLFSRSILDTPRSSKVSDVFLLFLGGSAVGLMATSLWGYTALTNRFASIMVTYAPLLVLPAAITGFRQRIPSSALVSMGFFFFSIGAGAVGAKDLGLLDLNFLTLHGMLLGSVGEAILFSVALGLRMSSLTREKAEAENSAKSAEYELQVKSQLLESEKQIARFATQVAHDIRSPLAALSAVEPELEALSEEARALIREAVKRIRSTAKGLLDLNKRIQSSSRVQEKQDLSPFNVADALSQLITEKRAEYRSKPSVEILFQNYSGRPPLLVKGVEEDFKRLLSNLINNAVEALKSHAGRVEVVVNSFSEASNEFVRVQIEDTGVGMTAEVLRKVGEHGFSHGKADGSGLGVAHARTCIESWGGNLTLESERNEGTVVTIVLPRTDDINKDQTSDP